MTNESSRDDSASSFENNHEYDFGGTGHEEFGKLKEARKEFLKWADSKNRGIYHKQ